jgi:hypothetical protein
VPTFFGIDRVVPRRASRDVAPRHDDRACLAALQGGQAGAPFIQRRPAQLVIFG